MSCKDCTSNANIIMPCKCCELVNGDTTPKPVRWCESCKAYICVSCEPETLKRLLAAAINVVSKVSEKAKSFTQKLTESLTKKKDNEH